MKIPQASTFGMVIIDADGSSSNLFKDLCSELPEQVRRVVVVRKKKPDLDDTYMRIPTHQNPKFAQELMNHIRKYVKTGLYSLDEDGPRYEIIQSNIETQGKEFYEVITSDKKVGKILERFQKDGAVSSSKEISSR